MNYTAFFHSVTRLSEPYPYQARLAAEQPWPDLLNVPTGLGKTAAVTLAWLYKRGWQNGARDDDAINPHTPRRLIWCLPMRVLVEQTERNVIEWLDALGIRGKPGEDKVSVHLLMGGESDLKTWAEHPEEDMILIGTQDMLLSRALMRGYGMSRYQWPVHFALLHNDALWAFDEVQLMGAGLTTSAQLDAFRRRFPTGRSSHSLWLSATLNRAWLHTIDLAPHLDQFVALELSDADRTQAGKRLTAVKSLHRCPVSLSSDNTNKAGLAAYLDALAAQVIAAHDTATQTLVILNRVDRAQGLFERLRKARPEAADLLIHARFRAAERRSAEQRLTDDTAVDRIVVATQAIEAGVDISSRTLITELAPWSSLVQRFGRCNRAGEHEQADVYWIDTDRNLDDKDLKPYDREAIDAARAKLAPLLSVGLADLPGTDEAPPLTPVLRRKDLLDLFNTDPDLSGFDVDVSDYIRDSDSPGLHVFWRDVADPNQPEPQAPPGRNELCPVSVAQALGKRGRWRWDSLAGAWQRHSGDPRPGQTLMLAASEGGYDSDLGFRADSKSAVTALAPDQATPTERFDGDHRSATQRPIALPEHLGNAARHAQGLCDVIGESDFPAPIIRAARWHDVGKAHPVFDASMHRCPNAPVGLLAKSDCPGPMRHERPHFRHELASALAWLAQHDATDRPDPETDLIAYLIAAHHGKVRMSLRAMPTEKSAPDAARFARGIWEGDQLPILDFDGEHSDAHTLSLALMEIGDGPQGRSWGARTLALLDQHGPFRLAWLETLVRIADWRASAAEQAADTHEPRPHRAIGRPYFEDAHDD